MVQKATPILRRRGRPPSFDREAVVSAAIEAFWSKGFAATTLTDLEEATGVDRSTLYNSFEGKEGLYRSAASAYVSRAEEILFDPLFDGTDGIGDIIEFIDRVADALCSDSTPPGCLIVNDMVAPIDHQSTDRYFGCLESGLRVALERASASGETDPEKTAQRRRFLTAAVLGVNLVNRSTAHTTSTRTLIDGLRSEVKSWVDHE